jgi:rhodanese-related sulfurtransferase
MRASILVMVALLTVSVAPLATVSVRAADGVRTDGKTAFRTVELKEFEQLRADTNNVVLDVRTKKEFDAGHIPGAILIDVNGGSFEATAGKLDPKKLYLVHCAAGIRSMKACNILSGLQFTNLVNLKAGYKGWEAAGNKPAK